MFRNIYHLGIVVTVVARDANIIEKVFLEDSREEFYLAINCNYFININRCLENFLETVKTYLSLEELYIFCV